MEYKQNNFNKRILFVGMPDTAFVTLHALHNKQVNIIAVVTPPKTHPASLIFCEYVKKLNLPIICPEKTINEEGVVNKIKELNIDLAVVTSYSQKFSEELLKTTKDGFINVHPSLLPEYRGANPYTHVLLNGEEQTGVTIHKMDANFDTGNILMQTSLPIMQNETMGTLFNKLNRMSADMLIQFLAVYEKNELPQGISQTELPMPKNYASKIIPETQQVMLDWSKSAVYLERFIRSLNPFLPATTSYKGYSLKIFSADIEPMPKILKKDIGLVCRIGKTIDVITGDGILKIKTLQMGSFFVGDAKDFISRVKIKVGDRLE